MDERALIVMAKDYQKRMLEAFKIVFKRPPLNNQELMGFSLAVFLVNNPNLNELTLTAAGVIKLFIPSGPTNFTTYDSLTLIREALTQMQILSDLQEAEKKATGKSADTKVPVLTALDPKDMN